MLSGYVNRVQLLGCLTAVLLPSIESFDRRLLANESAALIPNGNVILQVNDPASELRQREAQRIETLQKITPSVVCVMAPDGQGGGSGVLISADGFAISNFHVTSGSGAFMKCGLSDGRLYDAVIVGIDPTGDIALIRLIGRDDFSFAQPGNSDHVQTGDEVLALGNPFLLASDFTPTVTYGIVSGVHRYQYPAGSFLEYTDCIQIDASINPGNSGGPLFDIHGNWIGINGRASFEKRGRVNSGAAYAISVRQVLLFVEHLKNGLIVDHGISDFTVETLPGGRVVVSQVSEVSEAWRRGLRPQDELVSFAGRLLTSANDFQNILGIFPEATRVPMTWRNREGQHSCTIRLRPLHAFAKAPELPGERRPSDPDSPEFPQDPHAEEAEKVEVPPELKALYEERDGFMNYYFNKLKKDRLLGSLREAISIPVDTPTTWVLSGKEGDKNNVELVVGSAGAGLTIGRRKTGDSTPGDSNLPGTDWYQSAADPDPQNEPVRYFGLLSAALQWHRLFTSAETGFDEVTAMGRTTHLPTGSQADVILTREGTRTSRWYFTADNHLPMGVDVVLVEGFDEARIVFADWKSADGMPMPTRLGVVDAASEEVKWLSFESFNIRQPAVK